MDKTGLPFLPTNTLHEIPEENHALFDDDCQSWLSYGELRTKVEEISHSFACNERALVLCALPRSIEGVISYLAAVHAGHAVILMDPTAPNISAIANRYKVDFAFAPKGTFFDGFNEIEWAHNSLSLFKIKSPHKETVHPDFFLMLLTSGTTGSSKGVRLSYTNIAHNTGAICQSLSLTSAHTALCHLPLSYSFGLSVLHTQLAVGGSCLLSEKGMMDSAFWQMAKEQKATLFPGVPYHYEMLLRLGLDRLNLPSLRTFLQAGGKLQVPMAEKLLSAVQKCEKGELFIMYGQTEASPRMSCFALHLHPEKIGSSGQALSNGRLTVKDGQIIYTGPNVMMGLAQWRADLSRGDDMGGCLETGDLGSIDEDGYLTITGRKQRFAKLYGQRIALDDLEHIAAALAFTVAVEHPDKIVLLTNETHEDILAEIKKRIVSKTKLNSAWIEILSLETLPLKSNGKVDYQRVRSMVA